MALQRILIICGAGYVSGKEIMALELGNGLVESGQSVSYVTSFWNNGDFINRLQRLKLPVHILPIGFISATLCWDCLRMTGEQLWRWPGLVRGYFRVLKVQRPARIVHTNWHHLLMLLPFLRPARDLYWLHEIIPNRPRFRRVFRWFERRLGCFICVSDAVASSLRQLGIEERKIRVIRNGLQDPAAELGPMNLAQNKTFRIGIVGQVEPWKGHSDLLEAFALVRSRHPQTELHVFGVGDRTYQTELLRQSIELRVSDAVKWHGFVSDRGPIYKGLDVCVLPSRSDDPLPTTALEAAFFRIPVIATRRGGLPEIIDHEVNGLLVDAKSPGQIASAICRLVEQPDYRNVLGENARQSALSRFGRERFVRDFLSALAA
jgi:glycosyltransferase involved in cell wall biosynthesis